MINSPSHFLCAAPHFSAVAQLSITPNYWPITIRWRSKIVEKVKTRAANNETVRAAYVSTEWTARRTHILYHRRQHSGRSHFIITTWLVQQEKKRKRRSRARGPFNRALKPQFTIRSGGESLDLKIYRLHRQGGEQLRLLLLQHAF